REDPRQGFFPRLEWLHIHDFGECFKILLDSLSERFGNLFIVLYLKFPKFTRKFERGGVACFRLLLERSGQGCIQTFWDVVAPAGRRRWSLVHHSNYRFANRLRKKRCLLNEEF